MISNIFLGIRNAGDTALLVLFVLFGIASLICVFHSPRQVLIIYIYEEEIRNENIIISSCASNIFVNYKILDGE